MTDNIFKAAVFAALLFLCLGVPLPAQSGRYRIEQRYVQRLAWVADEYALKYEVEVERDEGEGYRAYMSEFTELPHVEISLPPGDYRYRVVPYDYLEQAGEASEWVIHRVQAAPIVPVEVRADEEENYVLHPYEEGELVPGVSEIVIKNPGEVKSEEGVITVEKREPPKGVNIYLGGAWVPMLPLHGGIQEIYGRKFYSAGAALRFGFVFTKPKLVNPGLELVMSWYSLAREDEGDKIELQAGVAGINFVAQKRLPNQKTAVALRAGGGLAFQLGDLVSGRDLYLMDRIVPQINVEPSFMWLALKQFYVEAGLGYTLFLNKNSPSGSLRPSIGIGWQF